MSIQVSRGKFQRSGQQAGSIDIGFEEISKKRLKTSFFVVVASISCIYLIDESLDSL